jgi:RimJ/RimL family protein N-acetyltransferase
MNWPDTAPTLASDTIALRAWRRADVTDVFDACQDPEIQRWTRVPVPYLAHHASDFVANASSIWRQRKGAPFAVVSLETDGVMGSCSLVSVDLADRCAEVGYWVAPRHRGRGVARQALCLLADWALGEVGLVRLEAAIGVGNATSRAIAERSGFELKETRWLPQRTETNQFAVYERTVVGIGR